MMKKTVWSLIAAIALLAGCAEKKEKETHQLTSPDGRVQVNFFLDENGAPAYSAFYNEKMIVDSSALGFDLYDGASLAEGFEVNTSARNTVDETWEQPWGEQREIRNHYNEMRIDLAKADGEQKLNIVFRAFDGGLAFRYEFPEESEELKIMDERTEFRMTANHTAWWIPAYEGNRYEYIYESTALDGFKKVATPLTMKTDEGLYLSIHEADLTDYASMVLAYQDGNVLKCDLVPWKNGVRSYVSPPFNTPWRTIQIAEKPGDLMTNYMLLNLNDPNVLGDVSWFEPGKYVGVWWEMHINTGTWEQGPKHAANTENTKKYIDFAARHGFDGVLVEGWNYGWDGDWMKNGEEFNFTKPYPDYDIDELSRYAREKDVYLIGHHETGAAIENYEAQLEDAYAFLQNHGMKAVKTGYVEHGDTLTNGEYHHGQYYVRHFQKVIETAARHQVAVVAHEPIKATGKRRTYPNMISREGARGQEYNAWAEDGGNPPSHTTILPFTRMLAGPMDFTPGVFDIIMPTQPNNQINTTLAKQLALYVVIYAPMQMACDLPAHYEGHPAFQFIKDVAVDWETTRVMDGAIGEHVTIARKERNGNRWFVGSITNESPRQMTLPLDFLDSGQAYTATVYADGAAAHYKNNPTDYQIYTAQVTADSVLTLDLAASGGAAVMLVPEQ